ncbi:hypothetical protein CAL18_14785 [Bordetella genomosp. 7]|uniref:aminoglycoside 6'-N-acetyltransferase n=1 Tax=Bordetella genomosp. 7 TaxID=1416805 RepID=UPI000B9E1617|nr:aminoglycoside 6'-N-acetyltransferase [Bordetella genomosp. 7]OZI17395.1 hypothetical protein CAL18_14785 [Bordetella genomosp. 7]
MNPPQKPSPSHLTVRRCVQADDAAWLQLRQALWPECARAEHLAEMADIVAASERWAVFLVYADARPDAVGVAEVALRYDYVNGTASSPVAFLEGIYVDPQYRRQGAARLLAGAVQRWAAQAGCTELASDALIDNVHSHALHRALGFVETERVVFFNKWLR